MRVSQVVHVDNDGSPSGNMVAAQYEVDEYVKLVASLHEDGAADVAIDANPFEFWSRKEKMFPALSLLAQEYLVLAPTEAECERVFSDAGYTDSSRRSLLTAEHLDLLTMIHHNLKNPTIRDIILSEINVINRMKQVTLDLNAGRKVLNDDGIIRQGHGLQERSSTQNNDEDQPPNIVMDISSESDSDSEQEPNDNVIVPAPKPTAQPATKPTAQPPTKPTATSIALQPDARQPSKKTFAPSASALAAAQRRKPNNL